MVSSLQSIFFKAGKTYRCISVSLTTPITYSFTIYTLWLSNKDLILSTLALCASKEFYACSFVNKYSKILGSIVACWPNMLRVFMYSMSSLVHSFDSKMKKALSFLLNLHVKKNLYVMKTNHLFLFSLM